MVCGQDLSQRVRWIPLRPREGPPFGVLMEVYEKEVLNSDYGGETSREKRHSIAKLIELHLTCETSCERGDQVDGLQRTTMSREKQPTPHILKSMIGIFRLFWWKRLGLVEVNN